MLFQLATKSRKLHDVASIKVIVGTEWLAAISLHAEAECLSTLDRSSRQTRSSKIFASVRSPNEIDTALVSSMALFAVMHDLAFHSGAVECNAGISCFSHPRGRLRAECQVRHSSEFSRFFRRWMG